VSKAEAGLSLETAIRLAQEHSYIVKASRSDSAAAVYDYRSAAAQRVPTLSLSGSSFFLSDIPKAQVGFKEIELGSKENYQADFKLSVPLYTGGRLSHRIRIQNEAKFFKSMTLEADKLSAAYLSRRAYLNLLLAQALVGSARASLDRLKIVRQDVQNLYQNGMADSVDILDAELAYQKELQLQAQNETMNKNASIVLAQQIGWPPNEMIAPSDTVPNPVLPDTVNLAVDSTALRRPELKAFDYHIQLADLSIGLNKAEYFPNISGFGGYSAGKPNRDFFNKTWNDNFNVGLTLSWDFNLGGKTGNNVRSAKQAAFSARMAKSQLTEALTTQAGTALENLKYAYQSFLLTGTQYEIARHQYRLAQEKERSGQLSVNRLLELEAGLTSTEQMYRASMINYYQAETEYLYAVGAPRIYGGF
jgi:outer membrane protein